MAVAAEQILQALDPIRTELEKASGSKKGALTKRLHKIQDALLTGEELQGEDAELVTAVDAKNLERAREAGNGILGELLKKLDETRDAARRPCASLPPTCASSKAPARTTSTSSRSGR